MREEIKEFLSVLQKFTAFEERLKTVLEKQIAIDNKLEAMFARLAVLEERTNSMKSGLKSEIIGEIKADVTRVQTLIDTGVLKISRTDPEN